MLNKFGLRVVGGWAGGQVHVTVLDTWDGEQMMACTALQVVLGLLRERTVRIMLCSVNLFDM